ncbi:MAG: type II toxin-antitoxin system HipA family toxin [Aquidulcibacter sp.]|jgi:serine/threonine-protein kinase HipA|uniref:type II toxin-antitoxin system HipA family toxin n=1 Tax=Aquidulcibacter sp. TaxID=2052990 RepID=UPI0022BC0601|nr:type II toxin-antitoxin system HipA family toxin [Aquidulcibacter sp.]
MNDIEVYVDLSGETFLVGLARINCARGNETMVFEYDRTWLESTNRFALEPGLPLLRGGFSPGPGHSLFSSIGDSAPDTWGRRLMQRAERRAAQKEGRQVRTLMQTDYLLGVTDFSRLGALRFKKKAEDRFLAISSGGVPALIDLGRLLQSSDRILSDEETDEDLQMIFAPGSSLGGARPKASILDRNGDLSIAKFPKENDDYSIETWEEIALRLASLSGIQTPTHELVKVAGRAIMLSKRFDRSGIYRTPFLSAMAMTASRDGQTGSYPELVDALGAHGAQARLDSSQLYRRVVFNVMISNVDDHLRNHGFLWAGKAGWILSPAYDLNPVPTDLKPRILSTNIDLDEATCSLDLLESACGYFGLGLKEARLIIREVAQVTRSWRAIAVEVGAKASEISRMASAFEHEDLNRALKL